MFTCLDEFGPHTDHSSCEMMLDQMVDETDIVAQLPTGDHHVIVTAGCYDCFHKTERCDHEVSVYAGIYF